MTTLPNMGLELPVRGPAGSGLWDDTVDDDFGKIDSHNHTIGKGARIPTAAIQIDADLSFGSQWAPKDLQRIQFASVTALATGGLSLFVNDADKELYWRSNAGTNVKLTLANALNVAAFTGGIGGDYAAVGALVAYDDANDRYTFKQQNPFTWARLASGDVRLFETGTTESVFVGLAAPAALSASYTLALPLALPSAIAQLRVDAAGNVSTQTLLDMYPAAFAVPNTVGSPTYAGGTWAFGAGTTFSCPIKLPVGSSFASWKVFLQKVTNAASALQATLREQNCVTGAQLAIGATQSNSANAPGIISLTGAGTTIKANCVYFVDIVTVSTAGDQLYGWSVQP